MIRTRRTMIQRSLRVVFSMAAALTIGCGDLLSPDPLDAAPRADSELFMSILNQHRIAMGCAPLGWHHGVARVAQAHSEDMASRRFFSHVTPDGRTLADRLREGGVEYTYAGENIAAGQQSVEEVFDAWLASAGHRQVMESCEFTHHGLGREGTLWTLVVMR